MSDSEFVPPRTTYHLDSAVEANRKNLIAAIRSIQTDMSLLAEWLETEQHPTIAFYTIRYLTVLRREAHKLTPVLTRH